MSAFKWITNGLKNLGVGSTVPQGLLQSRLAGTLAATSIPPKPKRPMTAYFRFLNEVRLDTANNHPKLKPTEIMKVIGKKWEQLDGPVKQKYVLSFQKEMGSYNEVMEKYLKSLTPEHRSALDQLKIEKQLEKEKKDKKRRLNELGKPKKPASAFIQFIQSKVSPGSPMEAHMNAAKEFSPKWKAMSDSEKAPFLSKYIKQFDEYQTALLKWENEMLKKGNDDLVRIKKFTKSKTKLATKPSTK